ncbi:MAG TPA: pyridoxamine 5'-phosphate oxidase family protein [Acidimicrobiales bacterium]|nr:pyridoxamine 5'-phosphate oxidase family protein [Acidimicrobiales bacterium]
MSATTPVAIRPFMPGYGTLPADQGTGLLPWSWAVERLRRSHDYWVASTWPDGRPHVMPVWGMWLDDCLWFSTSRGSRKARNLMARPACSVTTDDAREPVVLEGHAELVADPALLAPMLAAENAKYATSYGIESLDPQVNSSFRIVAHWAFGLAADDFAGSPTKWVLGSR